MVAETSSLLPPPASARESFSTTTASTSGAPLRPATPSLVARLRSALAPPEQSRNVPRVFVYNFIDGACFSIWQAQVLQVLLYNIAGNTAVGWVSGLAGVTQLLAAIVAGYTSDKLTREAVCRLGAFVGFVAIALSIYSVRLLYPMLFYVGGGIWGIYMGLSNPASEALFADSVPSGRRTAVYNAKWIVQTLSYCVGYLVCLFMFLRMGNKWHNPDMQLVLYVGLSLHLTSLLALLTLRDRDTLAVKDALSAASPSGKARGGAAINGDAKGKGKGKGEDEDEDVPAAARAEAASGRKAGDDGDGRCGVVGECAVWRNVPYFIVAGDFILAVGSGMTVRYLPLFFVNLYGVGPLLLMGIFLIISVAIALAAAGARQLADRVLGRLPCILLVRFTGASLMLYLAVAKGPVMGSATLLIVVFVLRQACMNSTLGMSRSVLMDCVSKAHRGRWAAVESFSSLTWAGSATLGGYLADAHGYHFTFLITAVVHYGACLTLVPALLGARGVEAAVMAKLREERRLAKCKAADAAPATGNVVAEGPLSSTSEAQTPPPINSEEAAIDDDGDG